MEPEQFVREYKKRSLETLQAISDPPIVHLIELLAEARRRGNQIFLCGNGGSAATASHLANDLGKGASLHAETRFRVLSLTDNLPWLTALANDCDYSSVFVEQLKNFAKPDDLLIAISGSGNSPNVIEAITWANQNNLITVGLTGRPGGELGKIAQHPVFAESHHMGRIEEAHFLIQHLVAYSFMEDL